MVEGGGHTVVRGGHASQADKQWEAPSSPLLWSHCSEVGGCGRTEWRRRWNRREGTAFLESLVVEAFIHVLCMCV